VPFTPKHSTLDNEPFTPKHSTLDNEPFTPKHSTLKTLLLADSDARTTTRAKKTHVHVYSSLALTVCETQTTTHAHIHVNNRRSGLVRCGMMNAQDSTNIMRAISITKFVSAQTAGTKAMIVLQLLNAKNRHRLAVSTCGDDHCQVCVCASVRPWHCIAVAAAQRVYYEHSHACAPRASYR
jgi:hypothetical protein